MIKNQLKNLPTNIWYIHIWHNFTLVENFFGILKSELFYTKEYTSLDKLREEIIEYINYYNNKRIKSKLKMSPVNYRTHLNQVAWYT